MSEAQDKVQDTARNEGQEVATQSQTTPDTSGQSELLHEVMAKKEKIKGLESKLAEIEAKEEKRRQERMSEDGKKDELIAELQGTINQLSPYKERLETYEDNRRQDIKRLTDTQGEIVALRKRLDEERDKRQLNADNLKNIDTRIADVLANEHKRKQEQNEFFEKFSVEQIDRERSWKEWIEEADKFNEKTDLLETELQTVSDATRAAKKAEETYAEISQKIERRVHEIVEMQRLAEDRLRQEWVTFKADDQKRWTGYGLSQDETMRNLQKTMEKIENRLTEFDDSFQTMQDQLHQTTDLTENQMQELMNWAHQWLTASERVMGHEKKSS